LKKLRLKFLSIHPIVAAASESADDCSVARPELEADPEFEVARWLEETGRRRRKTERAEKFVPEEAGPDPESPTRPTRRYLSKPSWLCLLILLSMSFLIYFFADVLLQIESIRRVIVFVFS